MTDSAFAAVEKPRARPSDPRFSSGPCRRHPGWALSRLDTAFLGRSHRASGPKARLASAIERSADLLGLPADWRLAIVPGSDAGAFEMAIWSLLGERAVDALVWESFSADGAKDLHALDLPDLAVHDADYGALPDLARVDPARDAVETSDIEALLPWLDWSLARAERATGEETIDG